MDLSRSTTPLSLLSPTPSRGWFLEFCWTSHERNVIVDGMSKLDLSRDYMIRTFDLPPISIIPLVDRDMPLNGRSNGKPARHPRCLVTEPMWFNPPLVWSILRRFDNPQAYKQFVKSCTLSAGDGGIGSVRQVMVVPGMPAATSMERLDRLDDDTHVMMGARSLSKSEEGNGGGKTVVIESYVVDVPAGNSKEDTRSFADMIIGCNPRSLDRIIGCHERMERLDRLDDDLHAILVSITDGDHKLVSYHSITVVMKSYMKDVTTR
ncbi:Abscisic acid receptor PYL6 [Hibiscus syriacus]|uniref:Abscisic acid receptor PYL6 n=1 Tax=Hibiscus syriacus TaxID=106335 RepID=A0A6A2X9T8_HIBSY|nr:Abscisic acid receptor PYL6 [Hibiscus syriacus]